MRLSKYKALIQQFLDGYFPSAEDFARVFDDMYLSDTDVGPRELFEILQDFWEDVEAYSPLWIPEDIDDAHITEETLKEEAIDTLEKLALYIKSHPE